MSGQIQWITTFVLMGLFAIAIVSYVTVFANDNNSAINIANDPNFTNFVDNAKANVSAFKDEATNTRDSILSSTISPGSTTTTGAGQYAITSTSAIGTAQNILNIGYQKIFGSGSGFGLFFIAFLSVIGTITALYIVKIWKAGLPD